MSLVSNMYLVELFSVLRLEISWNTSGRKQENITLSALENSVLWGLSMESEDIFAGWENIFLLFVFI